MKLKRLLTVVLAGVVLLSGCASASQGTATPAGTPLVPQTGGTLPATAMETEPAETVAATETQVSIETEAPAETPTLAGGPDVTVWVSQEGEVGPHLVDDQGRSLYAYMNDNRNSGTSACMDDCAIEWPPLVVGDTPFAGEGVDINQLGTLAREDGSKQITFNGWPLYYSNLDTFPGSTFGQGHNGVWFLVSPEGEPIQQ